MASMVSCVSGLASLPRQRHVRAAAVPFDRVHAWARAGVAAVPAARRDIFGRPGAPTEAERSYGLLVDMADGARLASSAITAFAAVFYTLGWLSSRRARIAAEERENAKAKTPDDTN